jgi:hypothetical protein
VVCNLPQHEAEVPRCTCAGGAGEPFVTDALSISL